MDIANVCKTLQLFHGTLTVLSTIALPPPVLEFNFQASHTAFLACMVEFIGTIPPPPPTVPRFKY